MEITGYISKLLLSHDCVIIPELGGFIANYVPAAVDKQTKTFSPPSKEVVFNGKLTKNDGLLVNWIIEEKSVGYSDALGMVKAFVDEAKDLLGKGEKIHFENIGAIHFDDAHNIQFDPDIKENLLLDAFGLDEFYAKELEVKTSATRPIITKNEETINLHIHRHHLKRIAIGVPLLLALSLLPLRNNKHNIVELSTSSMAPSLSVSTENVKPNEAELTAKKEAVVSVEEKATKAFNYYIITGSFLVPDNANRLEQNLSNNGYQPEIFPQKSGFHRVAMKGFQTKQEAQAELAKLRSMDPPLSAWILEK